MIRRGYGRIVNLASQASVIALERHVAYCASKFAVRGFSNALRHELTGTNVGITVVHPGGVATAIARNARVPGHLSGDEVKRGRSQFEKLLRMPPKKAAEIIVRGVERDRSRVLVGLDAHSSSWIERLLPTHYWRLIGPFAPTRI
jgi:short-subunit dehydrogenase